MWKHDSSFCVFLYQATGGSGEYIWSSNNLDTTSVNVRGEITTGNLGQSVVTAADTRNQAHKGSATVSNNTDLFHYDTIIISRIITYN